MENDFKSYMETIRTKKNKMLFELADIWKFRCHLLKRFYITFYQKKSLNDLKKIVEYLLGEKVILSSIESN